MGSRQKTVTLLNILLNAVLLVSAYPFGCYWNEICQTTTPINLLMMFLNLPLVIFDLGLIVYFINKKKFSWLFRLTVFNLIYLLLTLFWPFLRHIVGKGFDIGRADLGMYPTFFELALSSYLNLIKIILPINILFTLIRKKKLKLKPLKI